LLISLTLTFVCRVARGGYCLSLFVLESPCAAYGRKHQVCASADLRIGWWVCMFLAAWTLRAVPSLVLARLPFCKPGVLIGYGCSDLAGVWFVTGLLWHPGLGVAGCLSGCVRLVCQCAGAIKKLYTRRAGLSVVRFTCASAVAHGSYWCCAAP